LQANDFGPLWFDYEAQNTLPNGGQDYVDFVFPAGALFPSDETVINTELICFWDNYAAGNCERVGTDIRVYTPYGITINAG